MSSSAPTERTALSGGAPRYNAATIAEPERATGPGESAGDDARDTISGSAAPTTAVVSVSLAGTRPPLAVTAAATLGLLMSTLLLPVVFHNKPEVPGDNLQGNPGSASFNEGSSSSSSLSRGGSPGMPQGRVIPSMQPFSTVDPADAHCPHMDRPKDTWPTEAWGALANASMDLHTSLPTNAWWENVVLGSPTQENRQNNLVAVPYTFDLAGDFPGLRIHFPEVVGTDLIVQTTFDWRHALQLGCVESVSPHYVTQPGPLSVTLNWDFTEEDDEDVADERVSFAKASKRERGPAMSVPAVRGSPYATMEYRGASPLILARQEVTSLKVDGEPVSLSSGGCGNGTANSMSTVRVEREAEISFAGGAVSSDDTWLVFVSEPIDFECSSWFATERGDPPTPGALGPWQRMPRFRLEAAKPLPFGVVRAALVNSCSSGAGGSWCKEPGVAEERGDYARLLKAHAEVYPSGEARVAYSSSTLDWIEEALQGDTAQAAATTGARSKHFAAAASDTGNFGSASMEASSKDSSSGSNKTNDGSVGRDQGTLKFLWAPRRMDGRPIATGVDEEEGGGSEARGGGDVPLIMFALLHHRHAFTADDGLMDIGTPTLHGQAALATGDEWSMTIELPPVSFGVGRPVRPEMVDDIHEALDTDIDYEMPPNYLKGEGDTYFSGKMLAKMGRIALIAEEMGRHEDAKMVAGRLAEASQVWLNGTAASPLLYDFRWGGIVTCGCAYEEGQGCTNGIGPDECPALSNPGMNFGLGFYNDHHFHFGYHIFAAAIVAKFYPEWGIEHHEAVTMLIRDIANPSSSDPFFPVFRHKDWFLGSSWALGIPTLGGTPYMNGRNQESSSEAVNAYDAVALYGHVMAQVFATAGDAAKAQTASLIRDTGRHLLATEVQSAQIYWQVADIDTPGFPRVYPESYQPHVVGMLWSTLAQMQTWFGAEAWKVYGIQMLPITAVSERLLNPVWVNQMLPSFEDSCLYDSNPIKACVVSGWSMLVHAGQAIDGRWEDGREGILALPDGAFETAGGNGHSRTSMLWFVGNRPIVPPTP